MFNKQVIQYWIALSDSIFINQSILCGLRPFTLRGCVTLKWISYMLSLSSFWISLFRIAFRFRFAQPAVFLNRHQVLWLVSFANRIA